MRLTPSQYDLLKAKFNQKRINARYELDLRTEEIYEKIPRIKEIDISMASESVKAGKAAISGNNAPASELAKIIKNLSSEKTRLLVENGYEPDYLIEHFECPKCQDTGFIDNQPCGCFKTAMTDLIFEDSNINDIIRQENFSTFDTSLYSDDPKDYDKDLKCTPYENILNVLEKVKAFTEHFDEVKSNLLIYGSTGLGKTFLTHCIAYELLESNHTVMYYTTFSLYDMLSKSIKQDNEYRDLRISREGLMTCDLLIIDDLGSELSTSFTETNLYSIINERLRNNLSTVISTNFSPGELNRAYGERVFSRFMKDYQFIKLIGRDIRVRL